MRQSELNIKALVEAPILKTVSSPWKVVEALPSGRYTLRMLIGSYGKTTQAAAQYTVPCTRSGAQKRVQHFLRVSKSQLLDITSTVLV